MFQPKKIWYLALKDLRLFLTDRLALFFFILFPLLFISMFSLMNMGGTTDSRLWLYLTTQEAEGGLSQEIIGSLETADEAALPPGEPVWATLHFSLLRPTEVNYKVSLRLRDSAGQIIGQLDRDLLNDRHFRTAAWPVDDPALNQALNVYLLPVPPDTLPGDYRLEAVLYNAEPPYPGEGVTGQATADGAAASLGPVVIQHKNDE
jgi:hypothetical protein